MRLISIDPGLDLVAYAYWDWNRPGQPPELALRGVRSFSTESKAPIAERLLLIADTMQRLAADADLVVIERPNRGGIYGRSLHKLPAVMAAMYWSTLGSGAIVLGTARASTPVELLEVGTVKKDLKQALAKAMLGRTALKPIGLRRTAWNPDELDAVAVGLQAMGDPGICRLAFAPTRKSA